MFSNSRFALGAQFLRLLVQPVDLGGRLREPRLERATRLFVRGREAVGPLGRRVALGRQLVRRSREFRLERLDRLATLALLLGQRQSRETIEALDRKSTR